MRFMFPIVVSLLFIWTTLLHAQEVKYIDLTFVQQRTELRDPPAPPADCQDGKYIGCVSGGASVADGAPDQRDPHRLGVYLLHVAPTEKHPAEPFEAEFKVLNTGHAPIEVPIHPRLSDLQPSDESVSFIYFSLAPAPASNAGPKIQARMFPPSVTSSYTVRMSMKEA